jgi:hypothetical protein
MRGKFFRKIYGFFSRWKNFGIFSSSFSWTGIYLKACTVSMLEYNNTCSIPATQNNPLQYIILNRKAFNLRDKIMNYRPNTINKY